MTHIIDVDMRNTRYEPGTHGAPFTALDRISEKEVPAAKQPFPLLFLFVLA